MDRTWLLKDRLSAEYREGIRSFITYLKEKFPNIDKTHCPCSACCNSRLKSIVEIEEDLVCKGFLESYDVWHCHGEPFSSSPSRNLIEIGLDSPPQTPPSDRNYRSQGDDMQGLIDDAFAYHQIPLPNEHGEEEVWSEMQRPCGDKEAEKIQKLKEDAAASLYDGCKSFSRLSFIVRLFHIKCMNGWSNKSFSMLLELLSEAFPEGSNLPKDAYATKQFLKAFDLGYEKIHACRNDCMLFRGDYEHDTSCHVCGEQRYVTKGSNIDEGEGLDDKKKKAAKILRYFPLIPRLQRFFMCSKTSSLMRWHSDKKKKDGRMRHPSDAEVWKSFAEQHSEFSAEDRNVYFVLAADGVNPFKNLSSTYSVWPVVLIPYNLPPWIGMKQSSFLLSMIIPGPKGPGTDIDVFLQPLVDELKLLWEGVDTFDSKTGETFKLRAALIGTINDFPAYEMLCGRSTKGRFACPVCGDETCSKWLTNGKKFCYMAHRRWLDQNHKFRLQKNLFDGTNEHRVAPRPLSGGEVFEQTEGLNFEHGKAKKKRTKRGRSKRAREEQGGHADDVENPQAESVTWKKRSIFFDLPYWKTVLLRHNIDVMHTEKNVAVNLIHTMLGVEGTSKDNLKARHDLVEMGIRRDLHPYLDDKGKEQFDPACYSMSNEGKELFCKVLKNLKLPDGYASNIAASVKDKEHKLQGLKSHDYHILMQGLLPVAIRRSVPPHVVKVVSEICLVFKGVCSKVLDVTELEKLQSRAVEALCQLETLFPPSFFTVMVHLVIHIVDEAKLAGPVHYRWMYPIERYLLRLKNYVRNRAHPEGSMAENYMADECATFCSRYLEGIETRYNKESRNEDDFEEDNSNYLFSSGGRKMGKVDIFMLDDITWIQAHRYVLFQLEEVEPFVEIFLQRVKAKFRPRRYKPHQLDKIKIEGFHSWFSDHVANLSDESVTAELKNIANGPSRMAARFKSFIFNGTRFHTRDRERNLRTQNSGLMLKSQTGSYSSTNDDNPITADIDYYGVLTDMIELSYSGGLKVVLFRGDWVDNKTPGKYVKDDKLGFKIVKLHELLYKGEDVCHEPFAISSQVQQVYYIQDPIDEDWHVVLKATPRDAYDNAEDDEDVNELAELNALPQQDFEERTSWIRRDGETGIV